MVDSNYELETAVRELSANVERLNKTLQVLMTGADKPNLALLLKELNRLSNWLEKQDEPRIGG